MKLELPQTRLRALPVEVIPTSDGVLVKRGVTEIHIRGDGAHDTLHVVLGLTTGRTSTRDEICAEFAATDRAAIAELVDNLTDRRLLVPASEPAAGGSVESALDIFYWNFGLDTSVVAARLRARRIVIVGVNLISRRLVAALRESGIEPEGVVDFPLLRNLCLFDGETVAPSAWPLAEPVNYEDWSAQFNPESLDCIVAASDFGGLSSMREWNEVCVTNGVHFLPIVLQDLIGYVGPLVVPGDSACFECFTARHNAHLRNASLEREAERFAFGSQSVIGHHPSMASVLGDLAAMELTKFYSQALPLARVGHLIEVNMMQPLIEHRKVLKLPRCRVCGPLRSTSAPTPLKETFLPGNDHAAGNEP